MIGYITLGTNDIEAAGAFYDELLADMGAKRFMSDDSFIAWTTRPDRPGFSVIRPFDGKPATVGNGVMIALAFNAPEKVDAFHARALALGGSDEGAPGQRSPGFYAAYFRDLDGNKLAAFCSTPQSG